MVACAACETAKALIVRPKNREKLCKECFIRMFEEEVHETIVRAGLFRPGERVAIGASGGKDSTVLASVLGTLNRRHRYGLSLELLSVDEGIRGYRDDSLETVKRNAAAYGMPLTVVSYADLYGYTMDEVVAQIGKRGNCTYCGVFRRQALDRGAALLGVSHVVTGHNADDMAETVMMNLLRGDLPRLSRATSIVTASENPVVSSAAGAASRPDLPRPAYTSTPDGGPGQRPVPVSGPGTIKRSKPLKFAYEKEIVLYAHHRRLEYFSTECVYSPEAFRGSARALIKALERVRPSAIVDIIESGDGLARLVPAARERREKAAAAAAAAAVVEGESGDGRELLRPDDVEVQGEGCGRTEACGVRIEGGPAGRGGTTRSDSLETEITLEALAIRAGPAGQLEKAETRKPRQPKVAAATVPAVVAAGGQTLRHCARCGYMSSQSVCKACTLVESLDKAKARASIAIADTI